MMDAYVEEVDVPMEEAAGDVVVVARYTAAAAAVSRAAAEVLGRGVVRMMSVEKE